MESKNPVFSAFSYYSNYISAVVPRLNSLLIVAHTVLTVLAITAIRIVAVFTHIRIAGFTVFHRP